MSKLAVALLVVLTSCFSPLLVAQEWRVEALSANDQLFMREQQQRIDDLARRHFGRQLNGNKYNDIAVMQRLLDEGIVGSSQVSELQAMGIILGELLKVEKGLRWTIYYDRYGRSRALQLPGFNKEFIFPVTQLSRKAEVGINVKVADVYKVLEQAVVDIRNKPPF
jgi:hypothetical protein